MINKILIWIKGDKFYTFYKFLFQPLFSANHFIIMLLKRRKGTSSPDTKESIATCKGKDIIKLLIFFSWANNQDNDVYTDQWSWLGNGARIHKVIWCVKVGSWHFISEDKYIYYLNYLKRFAEKYFLNYHFTWNLMIYNSSHDNLNLF